MCQTPAENTLVENFWRSDLEAASPATAFGDAQARPATRNPQPQPVPAWPARNYHQLGIRSGLVVGMPQSTPALFRDADLDVAEHESREAPKCEQRTTVEPNYCFSSNLVRLSYLFMSGSVDDAGDAPAATMPGSEDHSPQDERGSTVSSNSASAPSARYSAGDNMPILTKERPNSEVAQREELPPLQANGGPNGQYNILEADDPRSFDLLQPSDNFSKEYSLEKASQSLFSKDHLQVIFADPAFLLRFTTFLGVHRPQSVPLLVHYLDSLKSIRAIHYANAICEGLDPVDGLEFTQQPVKNTVNTALEARANAAFEILAREELPAFICHQYIQVVSTSIAARITGSLSAQLREASEGLAEVFCLTDPSRPDNPIVFASEGKIPNHQKDSI